MFFMKQLIQRSRDDSGTLMLLLLVLWNFTWPATRASTFIYRQHYDGGLCSSFVSKTMSVTTVNMCALRARAAAAPAFSFCPDAASNCIISSAAYPRGAWDVTQPSCILFSILLPVPHTPTPPTGTKRFLLSPDTITPGNKAHVDASGHCTSQGYEFGVISSAAEAELASDQVGAVFWLNLDSSLQWPDGSLFNQCELSFTDEPTVGDCFESTSDATSILVIGCGHDDHYSLCQTFD